MFNNDNVNPFESKQGTNERKSGFFPDPFYERPCLDPSHNAPTHLSIPPGQIYIHVCPSCGYSITLRPSCVTLKSNVQAGNG
jgi:hypothetical protein